MNRQLFFYKWKQWNFFYHQINQIYRKNKYIVEQAQGKLSLPGKNIIKYYIIKQKYLKQHCCMHELAELFKLNHHNKMTGCYNTSKN